MTSNTLSVLRAGSASSSREITFGSRRVDEGAPAAAEAGTCPPLAHAAEARSTNKQSIFRDTRSLPQKLVIYSVVHSGAPSSVTVASPWRNSVAWPRDAHGPGTP